MTAPAIFKKSMQIYRGDTFVRTFVIGTQESDDGVVVPVNLTAYGTVWNAQLRSSENSAEDIPFVVNSTGAAAGRIILTLDSDKSALLPAKGVWDLQVTDITVTPNIVRTLVRGTFVLVKDVTRP